MSYIAAAGCASVWLDRLIFLPDTTIPHPPPGVEERWITTRDHVRRSEKVPGIRTVSGPVPITS